MYSCDLDMCCVTPVLVVLLDSQINWEGRRASSGCLWAAYMLTASKNECI